MISVVFFDFFGVLHPDTLWGLADVFIPARDDEKKQALHELVKRVDLGMMSREDFWSEAAHEFDTTLEKLFEEKEKLGGVDGRLMDLIKTLKSSGVKTGVISNVGVGFLEHAFDSYDVDEYFDELVLSGEIGVIKPDRRIYETAAERVGAVTEQCLFFDDVDRNVQGAIAAGMKAVLYDGIESCRQALSREGVQP